MNFRSNQENRFSNQENGFSLLELMITLAVIALLAMVALPSYQQYQCKGEISEMVGPLLAMADKIRVYRLKNGNYPNDTAGAPTGIDMGNYWNQTTELGGNWNWEGPDVFPYAGIAISSHTASTAELEMLDRMIDDGDITTGQFRLGANNNGRPTYIIEDGI